MADSKKKNYTVGLTQSPGGQVAQTMNGLPVNTSLPSTGKTVTTAKPTYSANTPTKVTPLNNLTAGSTVYSGPQGKATYADSIVPGLGVAGNTDTSKGHVGMIVPQQEEKKSSGGGRGGSVLPSVPAQLANQIADAYARTQGAGPDPYDNRYQAEIEAMRGQRYGDYESQYLPKIDNLVDRLLNRDSFSYNWSDDPLYRQYAARYQQQARQGMQDTMGQAAALTGGYGSSYATAAANQAYANQMAGLNDRAMDLYQLAAENYDRDTNNLRSNLQQLEQREAANRSYYDTDRDVFYNRQDADLNNLYNQQAMDYQLWQDALARDQYEKDLAWQQYQYWNNLAHNKYRYY